MPTMSRSSMTTRRGRRPRTRLSPTQPGEILLDEFLKPYKLSQYQLAKDISVPRRRINEIVQGKRAVTADTAIRLARYFGTSERFWLNLQTRYDVEIAKDRLGATLARQVRARPRYGPRTAEDQRNIRRAGERSRRASDARVRAKATT